jgi:integrase
MSKVKGLYQRSGVGEWLYDLQIRGHRFCGSTGATTRRDAEKWITAFRKAKEAEVAEFSGEGPMSFAVASTRWWNERGQHRKDSRDIERFLAWLQTQIGQRTRIDAIDDNMLARLVAARRAEGVSPATVNRSVTEPLRAILARAALWGQRVARVEWGAHKLAEAQERIREASQAEETALFAALRPDFRPILRFLLITGLRRAEACGLKWSQVDFDGARLLVHGKGGTVDYLPLPDSALAILRGERGRHSTMVFTYEATGKLKDRHPSLRKGERVPIKPDTLSTAYWRARRAAGLAEADLRLHDIRHTAATRLTRDSGNLKLTQKMLRHKRITTTARYAHATEDDLRAAMNKTAPVAAPVAEADAGNPVAAGGEVKSTTRTKK